MNVEITRIEKAILANYDGTPWLLATITEKAAKLLDKVVEGRLIILDYL